MLETHKDQEGLQLYRCHKYTDNDQVQSGEMAHRPPKDIHFLKEKKKLKWNRDQKKGPKWKIRNIIFL